MVDDIIYSGAFKSDMKEIVQKTLDLGNEVPYGVYSELDADVIILTGMEDLSEYTQSGPFSITWTDYFDTHERPHYDDFFCLGHTHTFSTDSLPKKGPITGYEFHLGYSLDYKFVATRTPEKPHMVLSASHKKMKVGKGKGILTLGNFSHLKEFISSLGNLNPELYIFESVRKEERIGFPIIETRTFPDSNVPVSNTSYWMSMWIQMYMEQDQEQKFKTPKEHYRNFQEDVTSGNYEKADSRASQFIKHAHDIEIEDLFD